MRLKELQKIEFEMLKILHAFMEEHDLKYYMVEGTMLGAIRHKGFIPWDDDIDIGMPRKDYERFLSMSALLPYPLKAEYFKIAKSHIWQFAKVYNRDTFLIEDEIRHLNIKESIYIDIFPLDGISNNRLIRDIYSKTIRLLIFLESLTLANPRKKRNLLKQIIILAAIKLSPRRIVAVLDFIMRKINLSDSKYIANFSSAYGKKDIMLKSIYGKPTPYIFEGYTFFGPEKADEYLTRLYGDYMKLPPKSKRKKHAADYGWLKKGE